MNDILKIAYNAGQQCALRYFAKLAAPAPQANMQASIDFDRTYGQQSVADVTSQRPAAPARQQVFPTVTAPAKPAPQAAPAKQAPVQAPVKQTAPAAQASPAVQASPKSQPAKSQPVQKAPAKQPAQQRQPAPQQRQPAPKQTQPAPQQRQPAPKQVATAPASQPAQPASQPQPQTQPNQPVATPTQPTAPVTKGLYQPAFALNATPEQDRAEFQRRMQELNRENLGRRSRYVPGYRMPVNQVPAPEYNPMAGTAPVAVPTPAPAPTTPVATTPIAPENVRGSDNEAVSLNPYAAVLEARKRRAAMLAGQA